MVTRAESGCARTEIPGAAYYLSSRGPTLLRRIAAPLFKKSPHHSQQFVDCAHFFFDTALEHPDEGDTLWRKRFLAQKELQHQQRRAQWFAKSVFDKRNKFGVRS